MAFITLLERKILGIVGSRPGPNKTSFYGILQPISDALKLSNKQCNRIRNKAHFFYYLSSGLMLFSSLILWTSVFSTPALSSWKFPVLLVLLALAFNSLNSILSGWRTFRKYSLIGRMRTVSQLISYEAVLYIVLFFILFSYMEFNFHDIRLNSLTPLGFLSPLALFIWLPSMLAELNRTPYDFSEGERELVRGFNTEFGSGSFTLIFLAEYRGIIFLSILSSFLFFNSNLVSFLFLFIFFIIWIRSVLPRYRFDKLIVLAWKFFIPLSTLLLIFFIFWTD